MLKNKISLLLLPVLSAVTLQASDPFHNEPFFDDPFGDDLFKEMYEMQKEMDKVFERMHQRMEKRSQQLNQPNMQFHLPSMTPSNGSIFVDKGTHYLYNTGVEADKENEINLSVRDGILTFRAKVTHRSKSQQQGVQSQQRYTSVMQRSQSLPADADEHSIKMEEEKGMIVVKIRKKKSLQKPTPASKKAPKAAEEKRATDPKKPTLMPLDKNKTYHKVPHTATEV
ncbi:Hsp20 family protein [Sulfurovum mangrovi]|uniref:Hsp20 family protein n=1 Tax=Sulfurovum mangrovi TaxID=2893889 RepID=UPI001E62EA55|nr:Hsp20/alpha crystallin family protein [Sulfurovum mangrovi]UFH58092.1 Hsp20/alpha crystallin family protein [Sulfurovum mangrovi]